MHVTISNYRKLLFHWVEHFKTAFSWNYSLLSAYREVLSFEAKAPFLGWLNGLAFPCHHQKRERERRSSKHWCQKNSFEEQYKQGKRNLQAWFGKRQNWNGRRLSNRVLGDFDVFVATGESKGGDEGIHWKNKLLKAEGWNVSDKQKIFTFY